MTCWRITKAQAPTKSGKIWQVWEGKQRRKVFRTWREAMDYADTEPRAIRVDLPRRADTHIFSLHAYPVDDGLFIERREIGFWQSIRIKIKRNELEPLALALLAHHHKNQDTPPERSTPCDCTKQKSHPNHSPSTDAN